MERDPWALERALVYKHITYTARRGVIYPSSERERSEEGARVQNRHVESNRSSRKLAAVAAWLTLSLLNSRDVANVYSIATSSLSA